MATLVIDTETTGLDILHGCKPFMVGIFEPEIDRTHIYEWVVNVKTRTPIIPANHISEIQNLIDSSTKIIFHNASFDIIALSSIKITIPDNVIIEDTMIMSHAFYNLSQKKLKFLSQVYCGIPFEEEEDLRNITLKARHIGKMLGYRIAKIGDSHFPGYKSKKSKGSDIDQIWKFDMWLPNQIHWYKTHNIVTVDKKLLKKNLSEVDNTWKSVTKYYCIMDVYRTWGLYQFLSTELKQSGAIDFYTKINRPLIRIFTESECRGLPVNEDTLDEATVQLKTIMDKNYETVCKFYGKDSFNLKSYVQLKEFLYHKLKLPVIEVSEKGNPKTNIVTMKKLLATIPYDKSPKKYMALQALHDYKEAKGSITHYETWKKNLSYSFKDNIRRLYGRLNAVGTNTTRTASYDPNVQNLKTMLRGVFQTDDNHVLCSIDYSQQQLRVYAEICDEKSLKTAFKNDEDIHEFVFCKAYEYINGCLPDMPITKDQKRKGKALNFGVIFGAQQAKIEKESGVPNFKKFMDSIFPNVGYAQKELREQYLKYGGVKMPYNLTLYTNDSHKLFNYVVQGMEGIIVKMALICCYQYLKETNCGHFLTIIHDELVFELKKDMNYVKHAKKLSAIMSACGSLFGVYSPTQIEISVGAWNESIKIPKNHPDFIERYGLTYVKRKGFYEHAIGFGDAKD